MTEGDVGWVIEPHPPGSKCHGAPMRVETPGGEGSSYGVCSQCGRPADGQAGSLAIYRGNGFAADSEGPTLYSREEFEEFVSNLRYAAATLWPDE